MDPSAVRDLLLNLKLQLLALPALARWGVLTFAGIIVLREVITLGWNARQRRRTLASSPEAPTPHSIAGGVTSEPMGALPAPDPLAAPMPPKPAAAPPVQLKSEDLAGKASYGFRHPGEGRDLPGDC